MYLDNSQHCVNISIFHCFSQLLIQVQNIKNIKMISKRNQISVVIVTNEVKNKIKSIQNCIN